MTRAAEDSPGTITDGLAAAILNTVSDAILATDRDGVIRFWNPGATRIFGFTAEEAVGRTLDLIIPERLRGRHWEGYERVMATGETRYGSGDLLSVPASTRDARHISVEFTIVVLRDPGGFGTGIAAMLLGLPMWFGDHRALARRL